MICDATHPLPACGGRCYHLASPRAIEDEGSELDLTAESAQLVDRLVAGPGEHVPRLAEALARVDVDSFNAEAEIRRLQRDLIKLRLENDALSDVYGIAASLRTFPVPFDDHWKLVGAVDHCREVLEAVAIGVDQILGTDRDSP